jgi:hypothetical protein
MTESAPMLVSFDTTQVPLVASRRPVMVLSAMIGEICDSCGREFACGADDGDCWCARVALGPERLAILREHFERCLCPDCLAVAAGDRLPSR